MNDPVNFVDPMGLYDEETHFFVPYRIALQLGFREADALALALASSRVDALKDPLDPRNAEYHFSSTDKALDWAYSANTLDMLGTDIHILMDSFSHEGLTWLTAGPKHKFGNPDRCDLQSSRDAMMADKVRQVLEFYRRHH